MSEVLSHAEIDAILSVIQPSRPRSIGTPSVESRSSTAWEAQDFRRPAPLRGTELSVIQSLHAAMSELARPDLEQLLQTNLQVRPIDASQCTLSELQETLVSRSIVCQFSVPDSHSSTLLVWKNSLVSSLFSRLLGGQAPGRNDNLVTGITAIEQRLLSRLSEPIRNSLATTLKSDFILSGVYAEGFQAPEILRKTHFVWLAFELEFADSRDTVQLGIPRWVLASDTNVRSAKLFSDSRDLTTEVNQIPRGVRRVTIEVSAQLAHLRLTASDVASLQVGDLLMTDKGTSDLVSLRLDGRILCRASIGTHQGKKALRLQHCPDSRGAKFDDD